MSKGKRVVLIILGVVSVLAACGCGVYIFLHTRYTPPTVSELMAPVATPVPAFTPGPTAAPTPSAEPAASPEPTPEPTPYICPVDFSSLQAVNPDIYCWLQVDDTDFSFPVVQRSGNDDYYLNHNSDGYYSANGAIFTQSMYNGRDMNDPVTIMYGHRMPSGAMFGKLRDCYADEAFFNANRIIKVYMPDRLLEYKTFACVEYSNDNVLYYNDFSDQAQFDAFFDKVYNNNPLAIHLDEASRPQFGDRILMLSTCLQRDRSMRFLVMAVLQQP